MYLSYQEMNAHSSLIFGRDSPPQSEPPHFSLYIYIYCSTSIILLNKMLNTERKIIFANETIKQEAS